MALYKIFPYVYESDYMTRSARFIYVAVNIAIDDVIDVLRFFYTLRIINVVIIGIFNGSFNAFSYNPFFPDDYYTLDSASVNVEEVFPDKFLDINGYAYKILLYEHIPRLKVIDGQIQSPEFQFMKIVAEKQNAQLSAILISSMVNEIISEYLNSRQVDICLNTDAIFHSARRNHVKFVDAWETDGFCAIVPNPEIESHFGFIYKPFDLWTWVLLSVVMFGGAAIWYFLNKNNRVRSNSPGFFIFGFISYFFGQSVRFREHRLMQKIILQLSIMITFVLGTAYQSVVISMMCNSHYATKITSFDDLTRSDYSFYVSRHFISLLNGSEYYRKIEPYIVKHLDHLELNYKQLAINKIAIIEKCSLLDDIMINGDHYFEKNELPRMFFYKLDEKFDSFYLKFPMSAYTFFHQKLQEMSLKVFESGIKKAWTNDKTIDHEHDKTEGKYFMNLIDLLPAFYLLGLGLVLSSIAFLCEIMWKTNTLHMMLRAIAKGFNKLHKLLQKNPGIVQVRSADQLEI